MSANFKYENLFLAIVARNNQISSGPKFKYF